MTEAFDKVAGSLADAIAFAQGDQSKGVVHHGIKPERFQHRLDQLTKTATEARDIAGPEVATVLANATDQIRRAIRRAEALPDPWERFEIKQRHGPNIEFTGRLLCEASFEDHKFGNNVTLELYETRGGAMVAVRAFELSDGSEAEAATVIKPKQTWTMDGHNGDRPMIEADEVQTMRFAVMDAFKWSSEAQKMVRAKSVGWDLKMEVA